MELETWNFVYMKFKTIQFDTLVEIDLKGMITSINLTFFICVNLMESSKFDENFVKKLFFLVKSNWIRHELYILSLNLTLGISFSHINTWIVSFYPKNLFLSKFSSNFELFFNPIRAGGGWISPHFFQIAISPWKKGFGGPKFRDFS